MKKRRAFYICFVILMMLAVLGACSPADKQTESKGNSASEGQESDIVSVEDMKGTIEIPVNPQRVVDVSGSAEELMILEVPFVASANTSMIDGVTIPEHLQEYFTKNNIEIVGNYSGASATGDLNLEKIAELKPDLIIMNIRHEKVYEQLMEIAPTVMLNDDISFVNWRGRFTQLGEWFDKEEVVDKWLKDFDEKSATLSQKVKEVVGDETFAVVEANSVHFGSYYVYRTGGPGDLVFGELQLSPSAGVPEDVWGEVVDGEYFAKIDADHIFFFSDDGQIGETGDLPAWQNLKAVKNENVYYGKNDLQYNMSYTPLGKSLYMDKLANAVINHENVE